jgi:hypothetical protein
VTTLILAAHVAPSAGATSLRAALPEAEVRAFVAPGLSSAYHALAARLRDHGRLLPALLAHAGAERPPEAYDRIVFLSWSAGYAMAEELLSTPEDAAALTVWVALDSGYGDPTPPIVDLARRARAGDALYWAGFTDVPTTGYLSTGAFLAEVQRQAGEPAGLFHAEHWAPDPAAFAAAPNKAIFWREEHIAALRRGPAFLRAALDALTHAQPPAPSAPAIAFPSRDAVLAEARAALTTGVHEEPAHANRGPEIDGYLRGCVRRGTPAGVLGVPWCAAFASACVWRAAYGEEAATRALAWSSLRRVASGMGPPVGWRLAVAELIADARGTGTWHDASEGLGARPGDMLVMGRSGHDPRAGGEGHVAIVEEVAKDGGICTIGGNEADAVQRTLRGAATLADEVNPIMGWIEIGTAERA